MPFSRMFDCAECGQGDLVAHPWQAEVTCDECGQVYTNQYHVPGVSQPPDSGTRGADY